MTSNCNTFIIFMINQFTIIIIPSGNISLNQENENTGVDFKSEYEKRESKREVNVFVTKYKISNLFDIVIKTKSLKQ